MLMKDMNADEDGRLDLRDELDVKRGKAVGKFTQLFDRTSENEKWCMM